MSETIWRATDNDGRCWYYGEKPDWSEHQFYSQDGRVLEYYGTEKPPPGECWEMTLTRKGDIDTDGDPIGWKIVGIGNDGSVLCEKGNGQRRRYSFGDWAKEQLSGEAWERLVEAVRNHCSKDGFAGLALQAYEAAQSAEPQFGECETCGVGQHLPSGACDHCGTKEQEDDPQLVKLLEACRKAYKSGPGARRVLLGSVLREWATNFDPPSQLAGLSSYQETIESLTKERDEALRELANERASSNQVIAERDRTIAELQAKLERPEMPECVRVDKASKTGWSVGDIVRCRHHSGAWRVWRVYGVFLGAVNQESVIELECLDRDANSQGWACVPEDLLDLLTKYLRPLKG